MKTLLSGLSLHVHPVSADALDCEALVLPVFRETPFPSPAREIDQRLSGGLKKKMEQEHFEADAEKTLWVDLPGLKAPRILLVSLGAKKDCTRDTLRDAYGAAAKMLADRRVERAGIAFSDEKKIEGDFDAALEGFLLGSYRFDRYRSDTAGKRYLKSVSIAAGDKKAAAKIAETLARVETRVHAVFLARDLINEPANAVTPTYMTKIAAQIAKEEGLKLRVIEEAELKKMGMNLLLAVGMGSVERPRLVHLEYRPKGKAKRKVALLGKGVTFDSGGLSLKPQNNMYGMKCDMSGAAAVLAAAWAASKLNLPVHLHAIAPLVENLPSDRSVKPGDVFTASNGKSVEIENTDAEGRLILADALVYASKLDVDCMIDAATLTGACVVALGEDIAGALGNDQKLIDQIFAAASETGEKFWQLPMEKGYSKLLKSDVADMKNVGGKYCGAITAALFLSEFAGDKPWVHLDIAGPAFIERDWPTSPKGATGFAVRTFLEFLK